MFKFLRPKYIILAFILIIAAVAGLAFYLNQPKVAIANALGGVIEDFGERDEIAPLTKIFTKGSVEFSASEFTNDGEAVLGENFEAKGKLYFSSSKNTMAIDNFYLNLNGNAWGGELYLSPDKSYIKETEKLDASIGLVKGELAEDFEDSIFAYDSESDYAIDDEETYDTVIQILKYLDELDDEKMAKDAKKIAKKYFKELWSIICDHARVGMGIKKVQLNDGTTYAKIIQVKLDSEIIANVMEDFYAFLEEDEDVVKFIEKYEGDLYGVVYKYVELEEISLADFYWESVARANDNMDEIREDILASEYNYDIELVTSIVTTKLLKLTVYDDSDRVLTLDVGTKGIKKTQKIILELEETKVTYEVSNFSKLINVVMNVNGEEVLKYKLNKNKNEYSVRLMHSIELYGTINSKLGKTTVTVDKIDVTDVDTGVKTKYKTNFVLIFDQSDSLPKADKDFDRISDYDQDEIEEIFSKIKE